MRYHTERGAIIVIDEGDEEQPPRRNASSSPAPSTASSHTVGRTPSPPPSRVTTPKRPFDSSSAPWPEAEETPSKRRVAIPDPSIINLDDDSEDDLDENEAIEHGLDLEEHRARIRNRNPPDARPQGRRALLPVRNAAVHHPFAEIEAYEWNKTPLRPEKTVELLDGTFLHIKAIIHNPYELGPNGSHIVFLRGWQLKRCTDLKGLLPKRLNELCYVYEIDMDDPRPIQEQSVLEVPLGDVVKVRYLVKTNQPFPECRFESHFPEDMPTNERVQYVRNEERLVARWKFTTTFKNAQKRSKFAKEKYSHFKIRKLESLTEGECTTGCYIPAKVAREAWRGETLPGGSGQKPTAGNNPEPEQEPMQCPNCRDVFNTAVSLLEHHQYSHEKGKKKATVKLSHDAQQAKAIEKVRQRLQSIISLDGEAEESENVRESERQYTFGDCFCCGGGVSCAAKAVGLLILWAFDSDPKTKETYCRNNRNTRHHNMSVFEFVAQVCQPREYFVDILHLSPPCKFFSPMKTHFGCKNDVANESALFCIHEILKKCKPRIVTLEETFGLIQNKPEHFNALIHQFTSCGYSISWEVMLFQNRGLPQSRKRLVIVASCPGGTLPDLGEDTHCEYGDRSRGLKPFTSVNSVLAQIPRNAPNHDLAAAAAPGKFEAWNGNGLSRCLLTGGAPCHPNGERSLTLRDLATIQGFPLSHVFYGNKGTIQGMIGDAVPPAMFESILRRIVKQLEDEDGVVHAI